VAFSGDWNDDMYTLAHDDFARRHASQVLDVGESRRFVFRRNEGEDERACRMVDCRKPPWVPTEVQCSSSELYAVEHVRRDGPAFVRNRPRQYHWPGLSLNRNGARQVPGAPAGRTRRARNLGR
jgi:hypothetical protein